MTDDPVPGSSCDAAGTILYTAPNTPGLGGFTLNGRFFAVEIKAPYVAKPIIQIPANNGVVTSASIDIHLATNPPLMGFNNEYADTYEYQLAEDVTFTTNLVSQAANSFTGLITNKLYYVRVRAKSLTHETDWSEWSGVVSFATDIIPAYSEIQILTDAAPGNTDYFGKSIDLSLDNSLLVIGNQGKLSGSVSGSVSILAKQINNTYTPVVELLPDGFLAPISDHFGATVGLTLNKDYLLVSAPVTYFTHPTEGVVYILKSTTPGDWTTAALHATINSPNPRSFGGFGNNIVVSKTANPVFAISGNYDDIYIYRMIDGVITLDLELQTPQYIYSPGSGHWLSISDDGTRLAVGAKMGHIELDGNGDGIMCGVVYIYDYDGAAWNLTTTLAPDDTSADYQLFGNRINLSPSGNSIFVGDESYSPTNFIYVFEYNNGVWTKTQKFSPVSWPDGLMSDIAFSADEQTVIIGNDYDTGQADEYKKVNGIWEAGQTLTASDVTTGYSGFGYQVSMSRDKHQVIVSSFHKKVNGIVGAGQVYIYHR